MAIKGITSTRKLGKEEVESIELSIKVARMKKEKGEHISLGRRSGVSLPPPADQLAIDMRARPGTISPNHPPGHPWKPSSLKCPRRFPLNLFWLPKQLGRVRVADELVASTRRRSCTGA